MPKNTSKTSDGENARPLLLLWSEPAGKAPARMRITSGPYEFPGEPTRYSL